MNLNHDGKLVNIKLKHTKSIAEEIKNVPEIIQAAIETQRLFAENFAALDGVDVKHSEAKAIFYGYLMAGTTDEEINREQVLSPEGTIEIEGFNVPTRTQNRVDRLLELFHDDTKGNQGRSLADVFSAVTDYYTHESAGGEDTWKQYLSAEIGAGKKAKAEFYALVTDAEKLAATRALGEKIVAKVG